MYYRLLLINTKTGERLLTTTRFSSKKKATEFAEAWKKAVPNADCEVKRF